MKKQVTKSLFFKGRIADDFFRKNTEYSTLVCLNLFFQITSPILLGLSATAYAQEQIVQAEAHQISSSLPKLSSPAETTNIPGNMIGSGDFKFAGLVSAFGQQVNDRQDEARSAELWAGRVATAETSDEIQHWLAHYGTGRVRLNTDTRYSLNDSDIDLLLPLWEQDSLLFYTQGGIHRADDRTQSSIGAGGRYFTAKVMWGWNLFMDNDLTQHHARYGIGGEYQQNYLKLSVNSYQRLTDWKDSPSFDNYQSRPANGWDVRAEGYLPAMPSLGMNMTWEQYYGDEVALFGKEHRQRDPHSWTAGLSWTPFPLLTFEGDRKQGEGLHESRIGVTLRWLPGVMLAQQVNTAAVAFRRTLEGSRYDLVERNNDIVLEYRKKNNVLLHMVPQVSGYPGDSRALYVQVIASNGLDHISWDSTAFQTHGGKLLHQGDGQYNVVLPAVLPGGVDANTYTITARAWDRKGDSSETAQTIIVVQEKKGESGKSTFIANPHAIPVAGTSLLTFKPMDSEGHSLSGRTDINFKVRAAIKSESIHFSLDAVKEVQPGIYTASLTGLTPSVLSIVPAVGNDVMSHLVETVTVSGATSPPTAGSYSSTITPNPAVIPVKSSSELTLKVKDEHNFPVSGLTNITQTLKGDGAAGTAVSAWEDHHDGTYTATLTGGKTAGEVVVIPQHDGVDMVSSGALVTLTAAAADASHSEVTSDRTSTEVNKKATISYKARDKYGNPVSGLTGIGQRLDGSGGAGSSISAWTEAGTTGVYKAVLTGPVFPGEVLITPQKNSSDLVSSPVSVTFTPGLINPIKSTVEPEDLTLPAGGTTRLLFHASDQYGNPVPGATISTSLAGDAAEGSSVTPNLWTDNHDGTYSALLSVGSVKGEVDVFPEQGGHDVADIPAKIIVN